MFFSKQLIPVYMVVVVYYFGYEFVWGDIVVGERQMNIQRSLSTITWIFWAIMMYLFFLKTKDYWGIAIVTLSAIFFMFICAVLLTCII